MVFEALLIDKATKGQESVRVSTNFAHRTHPNRNIYLLVRIFALHFTFEQVEGTPWYLFVKADIHDRRISAKAPSKRLEKRIKGISYNNIKLAVAPHRHGSDVEGVKTHDTRQQASSDSKIC